MKNILILFLFLVTTGCSTSPNYIISEEPTDFSTLNQLNMELIVLEETLSNELIKYRLLNLDDSEIMVAGHTNAARIFRYVNNEWSRIWGSETVDILDFGSEIPPNGYDIFQLNFTDIFGENGLPRGSYKIAHPGGVNSWVWAEFQID